MKYLKYPLDLKENEADYVVFEHFGYRVNDALDNYGTNFDDAPRKGNKIKLYMPNSTPPTQQVQGWSGDNAAFVGPKGQLIKQSLDQIASTGAGSRDAGQQNEADMDLATAQVALDMYARFAGTDANAALQLGRGQIYNPNVELLYKGPSLRSFGLDFNFIPKNAREAREVDKIIREFKYWSAPGVDGINFLTIPDLWLVTYWNTSKKGHFKRMNPWRPAALSDVIVQDNPLSDLHSTVNDPDGDVPVHTKIMLKFTETDIITRKDHDESSPEYVTGGRRATGRGYYRGY